MKKYAEKMGSSRVESSLIHSDYYYGLPLGVALLFELRVETGHTRPSAR